MKKIFSLFVTLLVTTSLYAYDFQSGGLYYNITSSSAPYTVEVTYQAYWVSDNYLGLATATIPASVTYNGTTYSVTSIGSRAFYDCSSLTSITIPNSVTSIGDWAFGDCSSLTSITIPNSVTSIGDYAFYYCRSLTSITIPNSVTSIGEYAFYGCSSLTSITIGNRVTSIGYSAFAYCSSLTSMVVAEGNTVFDSRENCDAIIKTATNTLIAGCQNTIIPNSVTSIGYSAFDGCRSLSSITIPNSVTSIGDRAFYDCSSLTSITIPNSVTSIGVGAFYGCTSLTSVTIPNSVTSIGDGAFYNCSSLTSVTIPNSVTSIGVQAFYYCRSLSSITIPNSVTSIGEGAFERCSSLSSITCEAATPPTIGSYAFNGVSKSIPVYVPCGTVSAYNAAGGWASFYNIQEPLAEYSIKVSVNETIMGIANVDYNTFCKGAQISATPNIGYHFVQWNDRNTNTIRSFVLTQDTTFTAEFAPNSYAISTQSSNTERGTTSGDITTTYLDYVTISATANYGYHFSHWNDYNYDNPRKVQVTEDKTYTAYFDKNTYYITKNYDSNQGYINGSSSGEYLDNITLTAEPNIGYHFVRWSDGNTANPRTFTLTQDTAFTAEFAQSFSGRCGDNLYWSYDETTKTISITGSGKMYNYTSGTQPWLLFKEQIKEVTTSSTATSIGESAFAGAIRLGDVYLGSNMETIAKGAFAECSRLYHIYCYPTYPPFADQSSFANYNVYLHVPCDYKEGYDLDMVWGNFKYVKCIGAESEPSAPDTVIVTPGTNDVTITWPTDENADTYSIEIKRGDVVFCTLTFSKDGMLTNIAFAPSRSGSHPVTYAASTGNGLRFTVTSLDAATTYGYNVTTKDEEDNTLSTYSGEFTTKGGTTTDMDNIQSSATSCQKIFRNGQVYILKGGKTYNPFGQEL